MKYHKDLLGCKFFRRIRIQRFFHADSLFVPDVYVQCIEGVESNWFFLVFFSVTLGWKSYISDNYGTLTAERLFAQIHVCT